MTPSPYLNQRAIQMEWEDNVDPVNNQEQIGGIYKGTFIINYASGLMQLRIAFYMDLLCYIIVKHLL